MTRSLFPEIAPITSEFGFVRAPFDRFAKWLVAREVSACEGRDVHIRSRSLAGSLESMLLQLLPLTSVEPRRFIAVPTRSDWVAYFDNGVGGADAAGLALAASELACSAVRVVSVEDCDSGASNRTVATEGARIFELYAPESRDFLNYERTISVARDGARWRFDQAGQPLPIEDASWYAPKANRNKFSHEALEDLLRRLGIEAFSTVFYSSPAVLIERCGAVLPDCQEFDLAEARTRFETK